MATNKDWQVLQSTMLYKLLYLQKKSVDGIIKSSDLNGVIGELMASMTAEEVKHVESTVEKYS